MEVYENIVIGNFLYSLGFLVAQRCREVPRSTCINLMQQTPLDRALGDVMVSNDGVLRLIEFKRSSADLTKEITKQTILARAISDDSVMQGISRDVHWYVESSETDGRFGSRVVPYLDFCDEAALCMNLEQFTAAAADSAACGVINADTRAQYSAYLELVALTHGGLQGASGGLLVNIALDGTLRYVLVPDIRDLLLQHRMLREAYFEPGKDQALSSARQGVRQRRISRSEKRDNEYEREYER